MKCKAYGLFAGIVALSLAGLSFLLAGCSTPTATTGTAEQKPAAQKSAPGLSGPVMWAQNCGHCHNVRSPNSYSDAQWEVVALHMRIRANLTAEEHRQILAFLKSAH
jgi:hypothetical protein